MIPSFPPSRSEAISEHSQNLARWFLWGREGGLVCLAVSCESLLKFIGLDDSPFLIWFPYLVPLTYYFLKTF